MWPSCGMWIEIEAVVEPKHFILVTTNEPMPVEFTVTTFLGGFENSSTYTVTYGTSRRVVFRADMFYVTEETQRDRAIRVQAEEEKKISVFAVNNELRSTDALMHF